MGWSSGRAFLIDSCFPFALRVGAPARPELRPGRSGSAGPAAGAAVRLAARRPPWWGSRPGLGDFMSHGSKDTGRETPDIAGHRLAAAGRLWSGRSAGDRGGLLRGGSAGRLRGGCATGNLEVRRRHRQRPAAPRASRKSAWSARATGKPTCWSSLHLQCGSRVERFCPAGPRGGRVADRMASTWPCEPGGASRAAGGEGLARTQRRPHPGAAPGCPPLGPEQALEPPSASMIQVRAMALSEWVGIRPCSDLAAVGGVIGILLVGGIIGQVGPAGPHRRWSPGRCRNSSRWCCRTSDGET